MNFKRVFYLLFYFLLISSSLQSQETTKSWVRVNQLGYLPSGIKVAVFASKKNISEDEFQLLDAKTNIAVFTGSTGKQYGTYGPFTQSYRLTFTSFNTKGSYYIKCGTTSSPVFLIDENIYNGTADFALRYMRQQRSGFNPFLKDSCHTKDGYTVYG
ncbi:MAG: cellulase N-terminal Ig-like domain-containing protein, partial [Chitinophagaceae bacterium]